MLAADAAQRSRASFRPTRNLFPDAFPFNLSSTISAKWETTIPPDSICQDSNHSSTNLLS
jgi:hypothetical protein